MQNQFNYGHERRNFGRFGQLKRFTTASTIPSEYVEAGPKTSDSLISIDSSLSSLGSHWKKMPSLSSMEIESIRSAAKSVTSTPVDSTTPVASTIVPSAFSSSSSSSYSSSTLSSKNSSSDTAEWRYNSEDLSESTTVTSSTVSTASFNTIDVREAKTCLGLQVQGLEELDKTLEKSSQQFRDSFLQQSSALKEFMKEGDAKLVEASKFCEKIEFIGNDMIEMLQERSEELVDTITKTETVFQKKSKMERFVRRAEESYTKNEKTLAMISDNEKLLSGIRQHLSPRANTNNIKTANKPEDKRLSVVFKGLIEMVGTLPLTELERLDFEHYVRKLGGEPKRAQCEKIFRHVMAVLNTWDSPPKSWMSSFDSDAWKSCRTLSSAGGSKVFEDSSFALSDDSNLNDLDGELRGARVRMAVEGPNGVLEGSPWSTASNYSGWSTDSSVRDSIQSLNDPMTLSSYEMKTSVGESTLSSLSTTSMPNQTFDDAHRQLIDSMKTALSVSDVIKARPPRSSNQSITDSAHFSSLSDLGDEGLHTAKELSNHLLGVSDFSSMSLSDTQSSHPSVH
ncbi:hypothetical protein CRE_20992 [Caenorhabditis remanei]|uniref:Uncharacterized protein n=1 Tax=Caenorhabditis remanei TaxID=31234 RepID=E3NJ16_CAERE|nr:hypothetical protein CRE_20992 [Caenorhabditis remanei]